MDCTQETCPVSASIYGYRPNIPANAFFVAIFGIAFIVQLIQGIRYRTWTYTLAMMCGCFTESIGHAGRIMLHNDPFGEAGFNLQICTLTLAPAFLAAAVYLMLKHLVLATSPSLSRFPARYYTYIFITCDLISLVLQAAGGGTAATADGSMSQLDVGDHMMMAGLAFQVFTLLVFGALSLEFAFRVWRARDDVPSVLREEEETRELRASLRFRAFVVGLAAAFVAILARCVYRIVEMAGGWRNPVMQDEVAFVVLDSTLIALAVVILTVMHPGYCFNYRAVNRDELLLEKQRRMSKRAGKRSEKDQQVDPGKIVVIVAGSSDDNSEAELGRAC
ncbi:Sphingoid long-chain base transporter rsb1 protein [Lasiodiplodia theobromae]|uniref:Sphingoid long-chain base transporter RSB1 n=1 Tax=Lasiodiplodia theobromae TaxID=45133 RepID=A0A5N5DR53_9PEZI|nr:Sphingoid long-chain base transporter rsb1 protein [Lasiodiplodia theobromae]KAB2580243.1 Uncharacterized protein DBV05_g1090 [Lasiodiplodia theobromae]KAF4541203.1 Sphingoid long-chain base transporter rsb1 protein [Lasiodiplodia theobromae]